MQGSRMALAKKSEDIWLKPGFLTYYFRWLKPTAMKTCLNHFFKQSLKEIT
jgi:hypothetical protein